MHVIFVHKHLGHEKEAKEAELLPLKNQQAEHRREVNLNLLTNFISINEKPY